MRETKKHHPERASGAYQANEKQSWWHEPAMRYLLFLERIDPKARYRKVSQILQDVEGVKADVETVKVTLARMRKKNDWSARRAAFAAMSTDELLNFSAEDFAPPQSDVIKALRADLERTAPFPPTEEELLIASLSTAKAREDKYRQIVRQTLKQINATLREAESKWSVVRAASTNDGAESKPFPRAEIVKLLKGD